MGPGPADAFEHFEATLAQRQPSPRYRALINERYHFVLKYAARFGKSIETIPAGTLAALAAYEWPGNIRELGNVIERSVIVSRGGALELGDWIAPHAAAERGPAPKPGAPAEGATLEQLERAHILEALEATKWRVSGPKGAAVRLGLKPTTLESRMKRLGIVRPG